MSYSANLAALLRAMYPGLAPNIDYEVLNDGGVFTLTWNVATPPKPTEAEIAAYEAGPAWLAERKRQLNIEMVARMSDPLEEAWATMPAVLRLHNPQMMSYANQEAHGADMTALTVALSEGQAAVAAAASVAEAEAVFAAVTIPSYRGVAA